MSLSISRRCPARTALLLAAVLCAGPRLPNPQARADDGPTDLGLRLDGACAVPPATPDREPRAAGDQAGERRERLRGVFPKIRVNEQAAAPESLLGGFPKIRINEQAPAIPAVARELAAQPLADPCLVLASAQEPAAPMAADLASMPGDPSDGLFPPEPILNGDHALLPAPADDWSLLDPNSYTLSVYAGTSYVDVTDKALLGGNYGAFGSMRLWHAWGAVGSISLEHFEGGDQVLGTLGIVKVPVLDPTNHFSALSYLVLFDQFTDDRVDNLYLSRLRVQIGYAAGLSSMLGFRYAEPITGKKDAVFVDPVIGLNTGTLRSAETFAAYWSQTFGKARLTGEIGYQRDPDALLLGGDMRVALSERVAAYASATYDDRGSWAASSGLEFKLGGLCGRHGRGHDGCCPATAACGPVEQTVAAEPAGDVVRGELATPGELLERRRELMGYDAEIADLMAAQRRVTDPEFREREAAIQRLKDQREGAEGSSSASPFLDASETLAFGAGAAARLVNSFGASPRIQTWGQAVDQADSGYLRQGPQDFTRSLQAKGVGTLQGTGIRGSKSIADVFVVPRTASGEVDCHKFIEDRMAEGRDPQQIANIMNFIPLPPKGNTLFKECKDILQQFFPNEQFRQ